MMNLKKLLVAMLALVPVYVSAVSGPPYNYYVWFPKDHSDAAPEIDYVKVWFFKNEDHYKDMMKKIGELQGFREGFAEGYMAVNKFAGETLPVAEKAIAAIPGAKQYVPGLGSYSQIIIPVHKLAGMGLIEALKPISKIAKQKIKEIRIGYTGKLKPGQYFWKEAKDKDRHRVYMVISVGDDTRKKMTGPAAKIDMFPLWQGWVSVPADQNERYLQVVPNKIGDTYTAAVAQVSKEDFENAKPQLKDKD